MRREVLAELIERWSRPLPGLPRELSITPTKERITAIIGPRRAGKSWYLRHLLPTLPHALYLDFEHIFLKGIRGEDFFSILSLYHELYGRDPQWLLLDEVQNIQDWPALLRSLLDMSYGLVVSGSSSKLLSKEIATQLRGRALTTLLLPFSFSEFLRFKGIEGPFLSLSKKATLLSALRAYLLYGGFPEVVKSEEKEHLLSSYLREVFFADFVERHGIKNLSTAEMLFEYVMQNGGRELNPSKAFRYIKSLGGRVSRKTIYEYLSHLADTLDVFFVPNYSHKALLRKSWPRKVYLCDTGYLYPYLREDQWAARMEHAVFLHLLRQLGPLEDIYYLKTPTYEVDFLLKKGPRLSHAFQVTYASAKDEVERREIKALLKAKALGAKSLHLITWDYEDTLKVNNTTIQARPLWAFLLNPFPKETK